MAEPNPPLPVLNSAWPLTGPALVLVAAVLGGSLYANCSFLVKDPAYFRYFPPFQRGVNKNNNRDLGAEYIHIAGALVAGRGFADPFRSRTGPTAWMAPVLPGILAALRWVAGDNLTIVMVVVILLQDLALVGTGLLVVALARRTTSRVWLATIVFVLALGFTFRLCFQFTHDCWLVLGVVDLLLAGYIWVRPLERSRRYAAAWGFFGGLCALTNPVVGFTWSLLNLFPGLRRGRRTRLALALAAAGLTVAPWMVRNYLVFHRFIPIKSNLAFELYQSQFLAQEGVLQGPTFRSHPYGWENRERKSYRRLGEMAYLDRKWDRFCQAVRDHPADFGGRVANRFLAATLMYIPFNPQEETQRPWTFWLSSLAYPLPFMGLLLLVVSARWRPLAPAQWVVIGVYLVYLLPYGIISYYERYKFPLLGVEVLLVVWALERVGSWYRETASGEPARATGKGTPAEDRPVPSSPSGEPGGLLRQPLDGGNP